MLKTILSHFKHHRLMRSLLLVGFVLGCGRFVRYVGSDVPLGYDPGIYLYIWRLYEQIVTSGDFSIIPSWLNSEPLLGFLGVLLHAVGVPYKWMVTRGPMMLTIVIPMVFLLSVSFGAKSVLGYSDPFDKLRTSSVEGSIKRSNGARHPSIIDVSTPANEKDKTLAFAQHDITGSSLFFVVLVCFLCRTSIPIYHLGFLCYLKQLLGIVVLLGGLLCVHRQRYVWSAILFFLLGLLHRTTFLYGICVWVIREIVCMIQVKNIKRSLVVVRGGCLVGLASFYLTKGQSLLIVGRQVLQGSIGGEGLSGIFLTLQERWGYSRHLCILACLGIIFAIQKKQPTIGTIGFLVGGLRILLRFANFNRVIGIWEVFVIVQACLGICSLIESFRPKEIVLPFPIDGVPRRFGVDFMRKRQGAFRSRGRIYRFVIPLLLLAFLLIRQSITYIRHLQEIQPYISPTELHAIQSLATTLPPDAVVMVTHRNYTPRVMGYAERRWISPGLSDIASWDEAGWLDRRQSSSLQKCEKMRDFSTVSGSLYIRQGEMQSPEELRSVYCFEPVQTSGGWAIFRFISQQIDIKSQSSQ